MKKKITAIVAAAVLAMAALAGCGTTETTTADNGAASSQAASEMAGTGTDTAAGSETASGEAASETASEAASASADLSGSISMAGSTSMEKLSNALAESFMAKYPGVTVTAEFTGSGAGVEAVAAGSVDIGNASRNLTEEEKAGGVAENIVAIDGIAVVTDPANTASGLTREQLSGIYTGEIKNWKDAGGADQAIVVVGREAGSGTRGAFEELLEIEDQCAYANELDSTGAVMAKVAATPGAIGYVSLDVIDDTVKTLSIDEVEPTVENIKGGSYLLSRPFVMATKGEISEQNETVQALFDYLASDEGKALIESVGLIVAE
ncbi:MULTISPECIES: phosphate ABC transporter substrate-binding protein [Eisenbergiella]|uniref:Phosphate-binding protein n=1 Tax=Eisenbergiella porci TaxID=2652274 RepID=A0A6N7WI23_9FIRM|nr:MULTISPECIES: phosphate ABC transporter substrate-binding protein [Eisenbergiella]MDY2653740.1 phosphate ABC transporter substrate-binding protein [Eisenbergiella porci]MSS89405.1 phosphate ABC transporter substrate-binding protein [Eisenbergiella porci]